MDSIINNKDVLNNTPPNTTNTSTPESMYDNATKEIIYIWSGWGVMSYTPTTSGNYWTYIFIKCSGMNYSIFFAMASNTLYKYNFSGGVWTRIDSTLYYVNDKFTKQNDNFYFNASQSNRLISIHLGNGRTPVPANSELSILTYVDSTVIPNAISVSDIVFPTTDPDVVCRANGTSIFFKNNSNTEKILVQTTIQYLV